MIQCSRSVFAQLWICGEMFLWTQKLWPEMKAAFVTNELGILTISSLMEKLMGSFFSSLGPHSLLLPLFDGKSLGNTVLANQWKNRCKCQHSQRARCILGMHLHSFESLGRRLVVHLEMGSDVPKQSFPLGKLCSCSNPSARKTQQAHSPLPFQNSFG